MTSTCCQTSGSSFCRGRRSFRRHHPQRSHRKMLFLIFSSVFLILGIQISPCHPHPQRITPTTMTPSTTGRSSCRCGHSLPSSSPSKIIWQLRDLEDMIVSAKVVGGRESEVGSFPWMVGLLDSFGFNFCGGVLIRPNYVLTAAHCVHNKRVNDVTAVVGQVDLDVAYLFNRVHRLSSISLHPSFVHTNWSHDLAIIRLASSVHHVEPICLPNRRQTWFDGDLIVAGWGRTTPSSSSHHSFKPNRLHQVSIPQVDQYFCERTWMDNYVGPDQLCAGSPGKDTCVYDSGSPLMSQSGRRSFEEKVTVLAGITSFGSKRCGDPDKPGVYTRVTSYLDWIEANTRDSLC